MSKNLVNITRNAVVQEIEIILETYPDHPYQEAFANPDLRKRLLAYILNRIPNHYILVEQEQEGLIAGDYLYEYLAQTSQIEVIIRQGIEQILCEQAEEVKRHIPEKIDPGFVPSDWFG